MGTIATPRMKRTLDYATQEIYAYDPAGVAAITRDYDAMLLQGLSEREIIGLLLGAVDTVVQLEHLERSLLAIAELLSKP